MQQPHPRRSIRVRPDQGLIGIPERDNGQPVVRYFTNDADADKALDDASIQQVLNLAGAWRDLDSDQGLDELDRIRHESKPTPPIDLSDLTDS